eukprot:6953842-Pyramimonas_sp.AAC.1
MLMRNWRPSFRPASSSSRSLKTKLVVSRVWRHILSASSPAKFWISSAIRSRIAWASSSAETLCSAPQCMCGTYSKLGTATCTDAEEDN